MSKCPEIFDEFLDHLFPDKKCRAYVMNYLHLMLTTRNGNNTGLCLIGRKGTGKGIFVTLCKELVGPSNFNKAHRSFFNSGFNKILLNKQIIHLDEQPINTAEKIDMFKDYCNNEHNIESKGIDADKTIETFFQFFLTVNREVDVKVEQDDRRFSIPDITDELLRKKRGGLWEDYQIQELDDAIHDTKLLRRFGRYVLNNCRDERWGTEDAWMGAKFDKLCQVSLWEWQKYILDTVLEKKESFYSIERMKMMYREVRSSSRSNISRDTLTDFLNSYQHEGHFLGVIVKEDGKYGIKPSVEFMPKSYVDMSALHPKVEGKTKKRKRRI